MLKTEMRTTRLTQIADAELEADGLTFSIDLAAMTCIEKSVYDYNELLHERTGGKRTYEAQLEWSARGRWNLLCQQFGGPQGMRDREFTLLLTAVPSDDSPRGQYTFGRFYFKGETAGSYMSFDKAEAA